MRIFMEVCHNFMHRYVSSALSPSELQLKLPTINFSEEVRIQRESHSLANCISSSNSQEASRSQILFDDKNCSNFVYFDFARRLSVSLLGSISARVSGPPRLPSRAEVRSSFQCNSLSVWNPKNFITKSGNLGGLLQPASSLTWDFKYLLPV